ncbi:hypothetical protein M413DRAFT_407520 [Hebeloma cylindrosporum]|uniref:Uncharacterized protein n=1 Tax=Hebeloma cylindrosporum TaxID=76867 RepID=A0A0C3D016_HEBCY|nr:hypothetical protein M413DRAFT_407520 [Hebeloma cylindrosporum h7]
MPWNIIERLANDFTLSNQNADPANWQWRAESKSLWGPAEEDWKTFLAKWYGTPDSQSPCISLDPLPRDLYPYTPSIFIRESYLTMFDTVWAKAIASEGFSGVIITGQPGTGKTLFSYYLLIRLLQRKQVVLFSPNGVVVYLFYHNEVYKARVGDLDGEASLPKPVSATSIFIWSLFDILKREDPAHFLVTYPCFPVQVASPDPARYAIWKKEHYPLITGLPLWTRDELAQGLKYQRRFGSLWGALQRAYGNPLSISLDSLVGFSGSADLLKEYYAEEDTPPPSPEDALAYLLDAAIDHFGFAPRDVFDAVFNYSVVTHHHENVFANLNYMELRAALFPFTSPSHSMSDWILALHPVNQGLLMPVHWTVDFKSDSVARHVLQRLYEAEDFPTRQQMSFLRTMPETREFAGRLLEPFLHRFIATCADGTWPLANMKSDALDPPHFTLDRDFPVSDNVRFMKVHRKIVKLQAIANLPIYLENNSYYIPLDPNFPFFDAFIIELDYEKKTAILWILQITTSRNHECSALGYRRIREIIAILKNALSGDPRGQGQASRTPHVEVRYVLVVPKEESEAELLNLQWQFPNGWSQNRKRHDHSGGVYRLEVPLAVCSAIFKNVSIFERIER